MATVLIIGDTHCPAMKKGYVPFLEGIANYWQPDRVVHIGDLIDWAAISYHEKDPRLFNATQEAKEARKQVKELHDAFPKCEWLVGNHDDLPKRQAQTAGMPDDLIKGYGDYWEVDWKIHPRFSRIHIDGVGYSHGEIGPQGQRAALKQAKEQFKSQVIGHIHSEAGATYYCNHEFRIFGLSVGWGGDIKKMQFDYGKKFNKKPVLGCGVVVDGATAIFEPWVLKSR